MFDGDDPGCPFPRPSRAFCRRWTGLESVVAASQVGSSEPDLDTTVSLLEFLHLSWMGLEPLVSQSVVTVGFMSKKILPEKVPNCMSLGLF